MYIQYINISNGPLCVIMEGLVFKYGLVLNPVYFVVEVRTPPIGRRVREKGGRRRHYPDWRSGVSIQGRARTSGSAHNFLKQASCKTRRPPRFT